MNAQELNDFTARAMMVIREEQAIQDASRTRERAIFASVAKEHGVTTARSGGDHD
jgi:hypothetical protein